MKRVLERSRFFNQFVRMLDIIHSTTQTQSLFVTGEVPQRNIPQFEESLDPKDFDAVIQEAQQDLRELCPNNDLSEIELDEIVVNEAVNQMMGIPVK